MRLAATMMTMRTTDPSRSSRPERPAALTKGNLTLALIQVANLVVGASGCSAPLARSSCDGFVSTQKTVDVTGDVACELADWSNGPPYLSGTSPRSTCSTVCEPGLSYCTLPEDYGAAHRAAQAQSLDAGVSTCPAVATSVKVTCANICEGRITHGIHPPLAPRDMSIGDYFAACSYLEAASVHAFARLSEELAAHGAPAELLAAIRRAERDEVRHAELTRALARRYGVEPERPSPPPPAARTLFDILRENAIEGCIRETYGAAVALVRAARAKDPAVRRVMRSIARDECRHAELSWRIAAWSAPRLTSKERDAIEESMRQSLRDLADGEEMSADGCRRFLGLPSSAERRVLVSELARVLPSHAA